MTVSWFHTIRIVSRRFVVGAIAVGSILSAGNASVSCTSLESALYSAEENFLDNSGALNAPNRLPNAEFCTVAQDLAGANAVHCAWAYEYRTNEATLFFNDANQTLQTCFKQAVVLGDDKHVNHPDFYDQRQYQIGDVFVTISLKDKGALQQTYVFLAVHGVTQN